MELHAKAARVVQRRLPPACDDQADHQRHAEDQSEHAGDVARARCRERHRRLGALLRRLLPDAGHQLGEQLLDLREIAASDREQAATQHQAEQRRGAQRPRPRHRQAQDPCHHGDTEQGGHGHDLAKVRHHRCRQQGPQHHQSAFAHALAQRDQTDHRCPEPEEHGQYDGHRGNQRGFPAPAHHVLGKGTHTLNTGPARGRAAISGAGPCRAAAPGNERA